MKEKVRQIRLKAAQLRASAVAAMDPLCRDELLSAARACEKLALELVRETRSLDRRARPAAAKRPQRVPQKPH